MPSSGNSRNHYAGLAGLMGPNFDQGFGIFKRFSQLNARNLLYMQAELLGLQHELNILTGRDNAGLNITFASNVWDMRSADSSEQWTKILEIRQKLREYNDCLIQQTRIAKMDKTNKYDLELLIFWLDHKDGGDMFLTGLEGQVWDEEYLSDLISISSRASTDGFQRWFQERLLPRLHHSLLDLWREPMPGAEGTGISRTNGRLLTGMSRTVNITLSSLIPSVAVLALYFIDRLPYRLLAITGFSFTFSLVLAVFTTARPIEIFTATAAFASVQVVFVGGTTGGEGVAQCSCTP
ncbi:uncharacterized protein M421DRAFT_57544 [Didymella exigua CBS 183.55]|uniref:DUF6594 domain-containing protein n=1 Tax=Didymella exigua CBS 183.55 TaxID=1150837 RepID=A0A6A5RV29_9PLEO|nr:uncharacterized protein M421DRAFT_57544 [Didymella exigua CBS 183.55]KAF1931014.1 hypothetical protein M421DRAFT_57544 [Didymella exigua CBS 183.55]